jgi:hypothetical protein
MTVIRKSTRISRIWVQSARKVSAHVNGKECAFVPWMLQALSVMRCPVSRNPKLVHVPTKWITIVTGLSIAMTYTIVALLQFVRDAQARVFPRCLEVA